MSKAIIQLKKKEGFIGQRMIVLPPDINRVIKGNRLIKKCYLTAIGHYPHASHHDRERRQGCNEYIVLYCTEGSGTIKLQDKTIALTPNTFYILPKQVPHHYWSSETDPWTIYWIHFAGEHADHLFERWQENTSLAIPYDDARIAAFNTIFGILEDSFMERNLEISQIKLLDLIASFIYLKETDPLHQDDDVVSKSINYMKSNLGKKLAMEDFAREQLLSVSHFSRLFKAKTGSSPNHYFNQLKVQQSCQYLYFTDRNIKEICLELGFDDPYYFSRLFKKIMGISPAHYKNQKKKLVG